MILFVLYLLAFIGLCAICRLVYEFARLYFELQDQKRYARPQE